VNDFSTINAIVTSVDMLGVSIMLIYIVQYVVVYI